MLTRFSRRNLFATNAPLAASCHPPVDRNLLPSAKG